MSSEIIIVLIGIISNIITGWTTWFFSRRKYNTEVDHNYIQNIEEGLKTYDAIIEHNREEIKQLISEKNELRQEVNDLRKQVNDLLFNICLDLTCKRRIREQYAIEAEKRYDKKKNRFSQTESPCRRGSELTEEGGNPDTE